MFSVLILCRVAYDDSKEQYLQLAVSSLSYWEVELSQLLKQMKFCADELEALQHKQENMQELGMGGVAADIVSAKHKIQDKYLKAESQVFSALKSISKLKTDMQAYHQLDKDGYVLYFFPNVCIVAGTHIIGSYGAVTCAAGRQMKQPSSLLAHLNQLTNCKLNLKAGNGLCGKLSIMVQRLLREVCHLSGMHWLPHQLHQISI
jgi:hypothetical protein